jgi:polyisoprenoid-binding protein YceI
VQQAEKPRSERRARSRSRGRGRLVLAGAVLALVLAVGGPFAYINFVQDDAPGRLGVATATTGGGSAATGASLDGTWTVASGSQAGYRVKEVLLGQSAEAVGRTSAVTGELAVSGTEVSSGSFSVDLTQVASDEARRDDAFQGRVMETASYPTATFELTEPITLEKLPADGETVTATASGALTLHGTTRAVAVELTVQRDGDTVNVSGSIPVTFADYGIANPSFGAVSTEDNGEIEFLLAFTRG